MSLELAGLSEIASSSSFWPATTAFKLQLTMTSNGTGATTEPTLKGPSWADDTNESASADAKASPGKEESGVAAAQSDGATENQKGSALIEPSYQVNVKLADLQADPNNPLYSVKSFEQLDL